MTGMWSGCVTNSGGVLQGAPPRTTITWALAVVLWFGAAPLAAQVRGGTTGSTTTTASPPYRITSDGRFEYDVSVGDAVKVDGILDDAAWLHAQVIELPYESNPGDNTAAPVSTACMVSFDDRNLYLACEADDSDPSGIRAYITDRDDIGGHDRVVFAIDPFNDARRAFEFGVSALGVQSDAVFSQGGGQNGGGAQSDASWDAIWASAGRITETGYVVEASIPFKSLRFPSHDGIQSWGFYVRRAWPRSESVETRSMFWDRSDSCVLCQANLLTGFHDIAPGRNLQFTPTLTSGRTDSREDFPSGKIVNGDLSRDIGLDAVWGVTTDLTLNATVNPDFSQVEADVAQLGVNSRFALFFPEKRPFFLEGADFFQTPLSAVFTRTIADPTFGTKLTGKRGQNAAGLIVAQDEVNNLLFPGDISSSGASIDQSVITTVGRFRRDVGGSSTVGGLYAGREANGYFNRVGGVDGFFRLRPALTAQVQYLHSETKYGAEIAGTSGQPRGRFSGDAATVRLTYRTRKWSAQWDARSLGAGFRTDAGFTPQVDVRGTNAWLNRVFWANGQSWFTSLVASSGFWHSQNQGGRLIGEGFWANFSYNGPKQTRLWINPNFRRQFFGTEEHEFRQMWFGASITPNGNLTLGFSGQVGGAIDFNNARKADEVRLSPNLNVRIGRRVDLRFSHTFQRLSNEGVRTLRATLTQVRAVYNFSPRSFVRVIVQYRDTNRNPEQFENSRIDRSRTALFTQFLFSYKVNPQTVLFLGYSDNRNAFTDFQFREIGLTQANRSLFLKLGYAVRP
ncbi:MAG: DUF5916 domain-containing protein [Gemmatimonadota bacterium]|nr:MAG: DUF5916 domain-containing protein [Gemmatimonadota bacterium]